MNNEIKTGDTFYLKCVNRHCKQKIKLQCIYDSTMESIVVKTKRYIDIRNTEWRCVIHAIRTRKKNHHRKTKHV